MKKFIVTTTAAACLLTAASLQAQTCRPPYGGSSHSQYGERPSPMGNRAYGNAGAYRPQLPYRSPAYAPGNAYGGRGYGQSSERESERHDFGRREYSGYNSQTSPGGWRQWAPQRDERDYYRGSGPGWGGGSPRQADPQRAPQQAPAAPRNQYAYTDNRNYSDQQQAAPVAPAAAPAPKKENPYKPLERDFHAAEHSVVNSAGKDILGWITSLF